MQKHCSTLNKSYILFKLLGHKGRNNLCCLFEEDSSRRSLNSISFRFPAVKMPSLSCPLGNACKHGPDETTWKTDSVAVETAKELLNDHVRFAHQAAVAGAPNAMKAEKLVRPQVHVKDGQIDEEAWEYFCHKWTTYKRQASLTVATKSHLESCLGDDVTLVLFGRLGQTGWDALTEDTLLDTVRDVFVKKRNRMVNRLKLNNLLQ